jgi:ABC-type branched-subunit amino acid transport system substrate-binding protein
MIKMNVRKSLKVVIGVALTCYLNIASSANDIRVGMTAVFSGLSSELGLKMRSGLELGFSEINATGGIGGKPIRLIALDDGYQPLKAASNMRTLIDKEKVLAILGNTGTPTASLTAPIANKNNILMFGSYTGAGILRGDHVGCCVYNYRASYKQETALMIKHILSASIKPSEIAFFTQNDAFGDAGYKGAIEKLKSVGYSQADQLVHTRYRRNTLNVEQSVADMLLAKTTPKAIIMVGSYGASSAFIKLMKAELPTVLFYNISFTGSAPLLRNLGGDAEGVLMTSVVPDPYSGSLVSDDYLAALKKAGIEKADVISFEGYIVSRIFIEMLQSIDGEITRKNILSAMSKMESGQLNIGSELEYFKDGSRQASNKVWLNKAKQGQFKQQEVE